MTATARVIQLRVSEIFGPTIQGEGAVIGLPTVFVRFFGCDYRCSWCDSLHAVLPEHRGESMVMSVSAILDWVTEWSRGQPILVTLSGGNPALQPLESLIEEGQDRGLTFALETQGSVARPWFTLLDYLTLSPKPPSSGEKFDPEVLMDCIRAAGGYPRGAGGKPEISLKIVVMDEADFLFALDLSRNAPSGIPVYFQVGNPNVALDVDPAHHQALLLARYRWLVERTLEVGAFDVRVLPQLHTLAWGNARGR